MIIRGTQTMEQLDLGRTRLTPPTDAIFYRSTAKETKVVYFNGHECIIIKPGQWELGSKNFVNFLKNDPESPFKDKNCIEISEPKVPESDPFEETEVEELELRTNKPKPGNFIEWPDCLPSVQDGWDTKLLVALAGALPDFNNTAFSMAHVATKAKLLKDYCEKNGIQPGSFPRIKRETHGGIM